MNTTNLTLETMDLIINHSGTLVYVIDLMNYQILYNQLFHYGKLIELTRIESLLMRILIQNIGNIVTIETLRAYVWENEEVAPATMRYWIHRLLKKLKNGMIVNTRGVGYRLRKLD